MMINERSQVHDHFSRQLRGDRHVCYFPNYLIDNFESRISNSLQLDNQNGDNVPPYTCSFSTLPSEFGIISIADEDGQVRLINISKPTKFSIIATWHCHTNAVFDTRWLPGERTILTASGDQTLGLHDLVSQKQIESFLGHSSSVRTVDLQVRNSNVFASASRDGTIRLWDRRNCKTMKRRGLSGMSCVHCLTACHQPIISTAVPSSKSRTRRRRASDAELVGGPDKSVTSVAFVTEHEIASCGSSDGRMKIWDSRKFTSRGIAQPSVVISYAGESRKNFIGYSHLLVDHVNARLFAVCRDHVIYQFGLHDTTRPQMMYRGHDASSFYIRASLSPDSRALVCGSGDCNAYIYNVDRPNALPVMLRGFEGEVTEVKWSPYDPTLIVALSDDCWVRLWRMNRFNSPTRQPEDFWGLAERCRLSMRMRDDLHAKSASPPMKLEGFNCPNSPAIRQLNIESFLTTPSKRAMSVCSAFSAHNTKPVSPKKLIISPRKSTVEKTSLKRRLDADSPVRKRLRYDSDTCNVLRESQNIQGTRSPKKRKLNGAENIRPFRASSPNLPSAKKLKEMSRKPMSRRSVDSKKNIPITNFFHRSTP